MRDMHKESPVILAHKGPLDGMNWNLSKNFTIGRDPECDIVINDRQVSRIHAQIKITKSEDILISDLNSKNGTYVNGEIINSPVALKDGDEIKIALVQEFVFVSSDATLPLDHEKYKEHSSTGKLFIEQKARRVWVGDKELTPPLSVSQYALLSYLFENEGKVITREQIVEEVWGVEGSIGVTEQAIDALVRRLRYRLAKQDPSHEYIVTVRGIGYILQNQNY